MTLARWQRSIVDAAGNVVPNATLRVTREVAGAPLAALYSDIDGQSIKGNPFQADENGFAVFCAAGGFHRIVVTSGSSMVADWRHVPIGTAAGYDIGDVPALVHTVEAGYAILFETETEAPPSAGGVRFDAADLSAATEAYVSVANAAGSEILARLLELYDAGRAVKDLIILSSPSDGAQASWRVTGAAAVGSPETHVTLTLSAHSGATSFADDARLNLQTIRAGQDGQDGEVQGPGASVDGHAAVFDGVGGDRIKSAGAEPRLAGVAIPAGEVDGLSGVVDGAVAMSARDISLLFLRVAALEGGAVDMNEGRADAFADQAGIDSGASTNENHDAAEESFSGLLSEVVDPNYSSSNNNWGAPHLFVDRSQPLTNDGVVTHVGWYSTTAWSGTIKILERTSAEVYDILVNKAISHAGGGWQETSLDAPFEVPSSGEFFMGGYAGTGNRQYVSGKANADSGSNLTGTGQSISEGSNANIWRMRATYESLGAMSLVSEPVSLDAEPDAARLYIHVKSEEAITPNTDLIGAVSRDGGTTFTNAVLALVDTLSDGAQIYEDASIDISGQPSGTSGVYRVQTTASKHIRVLAAIDQYR